MSDQRITPSVGDWITVLNWIGVVDYSYVGDPLLVVAVDAPFLAVQRRRDTFNIDTRQVVLMRLSSEYVEALACKPTRPEKVAVQS